MRGKQQKERTAFWLELYREVYLKRAYALENGFYQFFYTQCAESTTADGYEMFFELPLEYNYFYANRKLVTEETIARLFKMAGIHHTIRAVKRRRKDLEWGDMRIALCEVYDLNPQEQKMADVLAQYAFLCQTNFQDVLIKATVRYLFSQRELSAFYFAFIGNFWYNSYSSFMGALIGYIPFQVCLRKAAN